MTLPRCKGFWEVYTLQTHASPKQLYTTGREHEVLMNKDIFCVFATPPFSINPCSHTETLIPTQAKHPETPCSSNPDLQQQHPVSIRVLSLLMI